MTPTEASKIILSVEAAGLVVTIIAIFWHALSLRSSQARRAPRLEQGRTILFAGLAKGELPPDDAERIRRFPRSTQVRLMSDLAPNLVGADREWLARVAEQIGLMNHAEKRSRSRFWWRRLNGARILTLFGRVEPSLGALSHDTHPLVRAQAAEGLGQGASAAGIDTLIDLLGDPAPLVRFMARDSLIRLGRPAHQPIVDALSRVDESRLETLLSIAATSPSHVFAAATVPLATHPRAAIRAAAAKAMCAIGGPEASTVLVALLKDSDVEVRLNAVDGLASLGFWPAAPSIATLLGADDWQLRYRAAVALQNLGAPGELLLRRAGDGESLGSPIARRVLDAAAQLRAEAV